MIAGVLLMRHEPDHNHPKADWNPTHNATCHVADPPDRYTVMHRFMFKIAWPLENIQKSYADF
jgi:hypothetical protein